MDISQLKEYLLERISNAGDINEAHTEEDSLLSGMAENRKVISDLNFEINVRQIGNGIAFNANGIGNQFIPYVPIDKETSQTEIASMIDEIAKVMEDSLNDMEDKIIAIFNERGFRKKEQI